jgi:hypothetical protein
LRWKDDSTLEKENTSTLDLTIMYQMAWTNAHIDSMNWTNC